MKYLQVPNIIPSPPLPLPTTTTIVQLLLQQPAAAAAVAAAAAAVSHYARKKLHIGPYQPIPSNNQVLVPNKF
jgi:hypothetical protein